MRPMSTLLRQLKSLGLFRRKAQSDVLQVALFLQEQLNQYGMLHGYKCMHLKCIQAGLVVQNPTGFYKFCLCDHLIFECRRENWLRPSWMVSNNKGTPHVLLNIDSNFLWSVHSFVVCLSNN